MMAHKIIIYKNATIADSIPRIYKSNKNPYTDQIIAENRCKIIVQGCKSLVEFLLRTL